MPVFFFLFLWCALPGFSLEPGDSIPGFSVVSGAGQMLIRNDFRDKMVLLFYEDRNQLDSNQPLKKYLDSLNLDRNGIMTVVVVDCTDVGFLKKLWDGKLEDYSRKNNQSVYGDWNGNMKEKFKFQDKTSTFMIIDPKGSVVYTGTGEIGPGEFPAISGILK